MDVSNPAYRHGHAGRDRFSPTYHSWATMHQRCTNPRRTSWPRYGGRGISVCERWRVFENFLADMGERPPGTSLERNYNNGNYEPGNCRWATAVEQRYNQTRAPTVVDRVFDAVVDGHGYLPHLYRAVDAHAEKIKHAVRTLTARGVITTRRVPTGVSRGRTLQCEIA